ncbi:hypothetical protein GALMADRAFT_146041 [Galerina marginata CBS 339.88]|uniref:Uncharacterized protein n=1 Tax=Galerina marginata (strain CBS 339.88) TaxID=685588 RepID=A0A067SF96_GALM3|nr:hypothetical protein GALMADRAFT_146041 [Galerina marginata CBS 339.88]
MDFLPGDADDCQCTFDTCPTLIAQRKLTRLGPRKSVVLAAKEAPDSLFLKELAIATLSDSRFRRSGAATMFIRHILQAKSTESRRHWEIPAMGIINVLVGIYEEGAEYQDVAILQDIHSSYWGILDVIWKDFSTLSPSGATGDLRRCLVAKLIDNFLHDAEMKRYGSNSFN